MMAGYKRVYPPSVFVKLWGNMSDLVRQGRLVAPEEVYKELEYQEDDLALWAKEHRQMFAKPDYREMAFMTEIARDFPQLSKSTIAANTTDPFVVAMAKIHGHLVVSEEKGESQRNPKIPQICRLYHVSHVPFLNIVLAEGWVFR
jgi:hypothetical protein